MHSHLTSIAAVLVAAIALTSAPSVASAQSDLSGSGLILYTAIPTLEFDGDTYSGSATTLAGEVVIQRRWVGRFQIDILQAASLSGPSADRVQSGLAIIGSLGYRLLIEKMSWLTIDLLGHAGYAQVTYDNGSSEFTDASPQIGVGIAPHVAVTDRLSVTFSARTLMGSAVGEGTAINRTDIGVGAKLTLF